MPAAVSTERLSNAANRGFDGRISNSTPVFAYALARGLVIPDHRHAFRTLDELLNRCVAHLGPLGHEDRLQYARSGGLKRPPVLTALERNGMPWRTNSRRNTGLRRDGLAGRPQVAGFRLQICYGGWMSGRKSLSRAPEQSTSTSIAPPRQQKPQVFNCSPEPTHTRRHSPPTYLTFPSTSVLRANTGPLPVIASICFCSESLAYSPLRPLAPTAFEESTGQENQLHTRPPHLLRYAARPGTSHLSDPISRLI
ncbi:hypothetical protein NA56DRAFT_704281 [Hyaloscypha hepaticicola]|uniref:Uncharacterized protein n=1 Tax=Hyaloscypha hepaticicola TaxID=2082293 RepID=A0A2J6Q2H1_9HELO|nr:hypothetical protein NA56DRAFT_704281 [Hyaloscypha hepaticicola]